jgi:hypothetical protein
VSARLHDEIRVLEGDPGGGARAPGGLEERVCDHAFLGVAREAPLEPASMDADVEGPARERLREARGRRPRALLELLRAREGEDRLGGRNAREPRDGSRVACRDLLEGVEERARIVGVDEEHGPLFASRRRVA